MGWSWNQLNLQRKRKEKNSAEIHKHKVIAASKPSQSPHQDLIYNGHEPGTSDKFVLDMDKRREKVERYRER